MSLPSTTRRVRTRTVLQMESIECGAVSLSILLQYYGRVVPIEELRESCGVSRNGTKASAIVKAAEGYGLKAKGLKKELSELGALRVPFIVFWNFNHYVIVEGIRADKVYLNDPSMGPRTVTEREFEEAFTGVVLTFEPTSAFRRGGRRETLLSMLRPRLVGLRASGSYVVLATVALVLTGVAVPVFYRVYVDDIVIQHRLGWLTPLLWGMIITCVLKAVLTALQQEQLLRMEIRLAVRSASAFFWHVLRLPATFFAHRWGNEIGSRVELNDTVAQLLAGDLATNAVNIFLIGIYAVVMAQYDGVLTIVTVSIAALNLVAVRWVSRRRRDINGKLQQERGKLMAIAMSGLQMIETLKATGSESEFFARWAGSQASVVTTEQRLGMSSQFLSALPPFLATINMTAILGLGGVRVVDGFLTIGMLVAFQSLTASFSEPVGKLVDLGGKLQEAEARLSRLDDVLKNPTDISLCSPAASSPVVHPHRLKGYLEIRNLSFGFSRLEPPLITNFSLAVEPGQRVALVGASGSGKSTIAKLVSGLYQPWSGDILFDGQTRENISRDTLVNSIALVDQDIFLFTGTIRDNLTMWDTSISEMTVVEAAKDAQIHECITGRANGYEHVIEEGGRNFSGGQRQRLEIARAFASDPRLLILDEATSALDPRIEGLIEDSVRRRGCTSLVIAHRLSTVRDCDEIIVLDRGVIVERGTHKTLADAGGVYGRLVRSY
jgi:NHLM bacteriocin system ABC transporter peptidase/ATP-binding protein